MDSIKVLIVDDHKMFLQGIKAVLQDYKAIDVVATTNTVKNALDILNQDTDVELIITDIAMPEINGVEFIKILNQNYPKIKILVVSMFPQAQQLKGINGYILKETDYTELIKAIKTIVLERKTYFSEKNITSSSLEFNKSILTRREKEVVKLIAEEFSTDQIAEKLFLSKRTIETHKKNIFLKLQVHNSAGLIKKAVYLGYI